MKNLFTPINRLIICLPLLLIGCQKNIKYHSYQPVPSTGWSRNDTLIYELPSIPTGRYGYQIGIRHLESYPYQDLWIGIDQNLQDSTFYRTDTIHLYLTDKKGSWIGHGINGLLQFTHDSGFLSHSEEEGKYSFRIYHLMSDSLLPSINDIGIRLKLHP